MTVCVRDLGAVGGVIVSLCMLATAATGQVDCSNPDNLCTGDPCRVSKVTVQSPCVVDFSPRTLILGGQIRVPDGGVLDLTAGAIEVRGRISGRNPNASQIALTATGNIIVTQRINASGPLAPGAVTLTAGGNVELRANVNANGSGGSAPGGTVTIEAAAMLTAPSRRGLVQTKGSRTTAGGQIVLRGASGVDLKGRIDARGAAGGSIFIESTGGNIVAQNRLRATGKTFGGSITLTATGDVTVNERVEADGIGGAISVTADSVTARSFVRARDGGGSVTVGALGPVTLEGKVAVNGTPGGVIAITTGAAAVSIADNLVAESDFADGGSVTITTDGPVSIDGKVDVDGDFNGGTVTMNASGLLLNRTMYARGKNGGSGGTVMMTAGTGAVVVNDKIDADSNGSGGCIKVASTLGSVEVHDSLEAGGDTGGRVVLGAPGSVTIDDGKIDVDGDLTAGSLAVSGSTIVMSADFFARGAFGGTIEGTATGNLTANGRFDAESNGCIGLSAGGTLTLSGSFVPAPVASCPPPASACPF